MENTKKELPNWLKVFQEQYRAGQIHSFLFYQNVWDDVLKEDRLKRIYDVLAGEEPISRAALVVYYNRTTGIRFADDDSDEPVMKELFLRLVLSPSNDEALVKARNAFEENKRRLAVALAWFDELLKIGWDNKKLRDQTIQDLLSNLAEKKKFTSANGEIKSRISRGPFAAVIFEYVESLAPVDASSSGQAIDRDAVVAFQWWAQEKTIRKNKNLIIYITEALNSIAPELRDTTRSFYPIKIELPDEGKILSAIEILRKDFPAKEGDVENRHLAQLMKGLPLVGVKSIIADTSLKEGMLSADLVFERKSKIITEKTGGLLRIRRSPWAYETIGGLDHILDYIKKIVKAIRAGDFMAVPSGILFIGAPGTGKTVCAEVIAHEAGLPFAEFGSVRDPFVGMSERNMELALEILRANTPVIVFQDEIDTFFLRRGEVYHGDSGVSARLTGMLMEFLSDSTLRGKVVWIGATNRPDLLDAALLRAGRFDDKIPFLVPTEKERPGIIKALLRKQEIRAKLHGQTFNWELSEEEIQQASKMFDYWIDDGKIFPGPPPGKSLTTVKISLTGAEIEEIIQRADRLRRDLGDPIFGFKHLEAKIKLYMPERNIFEYELMNKMALLHANDLDFIPENRRDEARKIRVEMSQRTIDSGPLLPRSS